MSWFHTRNIIPMTLFGFGWSGSPMRFAENDTRAFTQVAKWGNSPEWHICNIHHSRDIFYCISIRFRSFWTLVLHVGVTCMRYMSLKRLICHSSEWHMRYVRWHRWVIYGPSIWYIYIYRKISNISGTKSQTSNVSRLGLQLSLRNILMPSVNWSMKM